MDPALAVELAALSRQKAMNEAMERGDSAVQQFYSGAVVFLTGGSGFLGKQLIEKLFRSCKLDCIYILMRPKKGKAVKARLAELLSDPIFEALHKNQPNFTDKIVPIEGDVASLDLGISDKDRERIVEEVDIIFHMAASIAFEEPLRSATLTNIRGTRDMVTLAKQCRKLRSFMYMSTAYSHATLSRRGSEVLEQFYPCPVPPDLMIELAETLDEQRLIGIKSELICGWPNTYSFTKALAEEIVRTSDLPVCMLRPTIVICTNCEPTPGWIDISSVYGPSGLTLGCIMGVIHVLYCHLKIKIDLVPGDFVTNAAIAVATTAKQHQQKVYHIGSSSRNPITWDELGGNLRSKLVHSLMSPKAMWYAYAIETRYEWVYMTLNFLLHEMPATMIDGVRVMMGNSARVKKIYSTLNKMKGVLKFYTTNDWIFNDKNLLTLYKDFSEVDKAIYHCDIADVRWPELIAIWCVGLRKYIMKDGLNNTKLGVKKQFYYKMANYAIVGFFFYFIFLFFKTFCNVLYGLNII